MQSLLSVDQFDVTVFSVFSSFLLFHLLLLLVAYCTSYDHHTLLHIASIYTYMYVHVCTHIFISHTCCCFSLFSLSARFFFNCSSSISFRLTSSIYTPTHSLSLLSSVIVYSNLLKTFLGCISSIFAIPISLSF